MTIKVSLLLVVLGALATSCDRKEGIDAQSQRPTSNPSLSVEPSAQQGSEQDLIAPRPEESPTPPLNNSERDTEPTYNAAEVALHNSKADCWIIIEDFVYDITNFFGEHPGGEAPVRFCGKDATRVFSGIHAGSELARSMRETYRIGRLLR